MRQKNMYKVNRENIQEQGSAGINFSGWLMTAYDCCIVCLLLCGLIFIFPVIARGEDASEEVVIVETKIDEIDAKQEWKEDPAFLNLPGINNLKNVRIKEQQIIQTNRSLKKVIEANEKLRNEKEKLESELKNFRGQRSIDVTRMNSITKELAAYREQEEKVLVLKDKSEQAINALKAEQQEKEESLKKRIEELAAQLSMNKQEAAAPDTSREDMAAVAVDAMNDVQQEPSVHAKVRNVVKKIETLSEEKEKLKKDEGLVRYNMGNFYFSQGKYHKAAEEYKQAAVLIPQDASAHFNLALVSGEYLYDFQTALEHYRQYLYLNPDSEDAVLVGEKILEAELFLRSRIDSKLEEELSYYKNKFR